jgi:hypothetical protein
MEGRIILLGVKGPDQRLCLPFELKTAPFRNEWRRRSNARQKNLRLILKSWEESESESNSKLCCFHDSVRYFYQAGDFGTTISCVMSGI